SFLTALALTLRLPAQQPPGPWDAAYLADPPAFSSEPNEFLVKAVTGLSPGLGLDAGMGQGRNALHLARNGWRVAGFDVSAAGVAQAQEQAKAEGLELDAVVRSHADFDWDAERWDLIVAAYFPVLRQSLDKITAGLRPGGMLVVEAYHADAALDRPPGPGAGVTFADNELLELFAGLRAIEYQDVRARADWGLFETRLVRLAAV